MKLPDSDKVMAFLLFTPLVILIWVISGAFAYTILKGVG